MVIRLLGKSRIVTEPISAATNVAAYCLQISVARFFRDVYGVRTYPRSGFLRIGSIKPHRSVRFVAAEICSLTIRDFPTSGYPIRSVTL